jgi:hypothetical protein
MPMHNSPNYILKKCATIKNRLNSDLTLNNSLYARLINPSKSEIIAITRRMWIRYPAL